METVSLQSEQEYCVNQNTANKVLQSLKQAKPELIDHLNVRV